MKIINFNFNIEDKDEVLLGMVLRDRLAINILLDNNMEKIKKEIKTRNIHILGVIEDLGKIVSYDVCGETFPREAVEELLLTLPDFPEEDMNNISYQKVRKDLLVEEATRIRNEKLEILERSIWNQKTNDDLDYIFQTIIGEVI